MFCEVLLFASHVPHTGSSEPLASWGMTENISIVIWVIIRHCLSRCFLLLKVFFLTGVVLSGWYS